MRGFYPFALALVTLIAGAHSAAARTAIDVPYAAVLRAFNPALDAATALVLADRLIAEADAQALDARLLVAIIAIESSWHPRAISSAGAIGLGQLMPSTAAGLGVDPADPQANIHGVALQLRALLNRYARYDAQTQFAFALSAYNAGSGAVAKYGGIPPYRETQRYVRAVILLWRRLAGVN